MMGNTKLEILCISNGHGEDQIAARICVELEKLGVATTALPLVGVGHAYQSLGISVITEATKKMPSGGFVRMDGQHLAKDLRSGLAGLTWQQLQVVAQWSKQSKQKSRLILAVGDIVPLLFAWLPTWCGGCNYVFIATAKSEYHWRDRKEPLPDVPKPLGGSVFYPWERLLIRSRKCQATFVRDQFTADILNKEFRLPVLHLGNPMMDGLEPQGLDLDIAEHEWAITLLPGSRAPEAYENWACLLVGAQIISRAMSNKVNFLAAISADLDLEILVQILTQKGWVRLDEFTYKLQQSHLRLVLNGFADCLHQCHMGLAMAGTATEQLVGLGKPVITIMGNGPQFTPQFAHDQANLLGLSVILVDKPAKISNVMSDLLSDPDYFQAVIKNGQQRMGLPGASKHIAKYLVEQVLV